MRAGGTIGLHGTGTVTPAASLSNQTIVDDNISPATSNAAYVVAANGNVYDQLSTLLEGWLDAGVNNQFEVMATWAGLSVSGPAKNTWNALTADREWSVSQTSVGGITRTLTVQIRNASTLAVLTTATITLTAQVDVAG